MVQFQFFSYLLLFFARVILYTLGLFLLKLLTTNAPSILCYCSSSVQFIVSGAHSIETESLCTEKLRQIVAPKAAAGFDKTWQSKAD
jgi:hypothetical protein